MKSPRPASLANYHFLHLESRAAHVAHATSLCEIQQALDWARAQSKPVHILGAGSNVLPVPYIEGLVLRVANRGIDLLGDDGRYISLRVAAGEDWHALVAWCTRLGYHGLANLAFIPGTVGAAPVQNIGAYGVEVEQVITGVQVIDVVSGKPLTLSHSDCGFGYRDSVFKRPAGANFLITSVDFRLDRRAPPVADYPSLRAALGSARVSNQQIFDAVVAVRRSRLPDPIITPNVGSFFKNPTVSWREAEIISMRWPELPQFPGVDGAIKLAAGWMIAHLDWCGVERDGVAVDARHGLVMVNRSAVTIDPFLALADDIVASVKDTFDITLEREPQILGDRGIV